MRQLSTSGWIYAHGLVIQNARKQARTCACAGMEQSTKRSQKAPAISLTCDSGEIIVIKGLLQSAVGKFDIRNVLPKVPATVTLKRGLFKNRDMSHTYPQELRTSNKESHNSL